MTSTSFSMSGNKVILDLPEISRLLEIATITLSNKLQDDLRHINAELSASGVAAYKDGNVQENYRRLSHANTARTNFAKTAKDFADSVHALFHVTEACKRGDVNFESNHHWSRLEATRE